MRLVIWDVSSSLKRNFNVRLGSWIPTGTQGLVYAKKNVNTIATDAQAIEAARASETMVFAKCFRSPFY